MSLAGAGGVRFWGFSPATDLSEHAPEKSDEPLKALMISPGDVRHVLKTAAECARRAAETKVPAREIEFSVYEREPEVLARHMLLLSIALDYELPR